MPASPMTATARSVRGPYGRAMSALRIRGGDTARVPDRLRDVLSAIADELVERLDADASAISRVIGDVLIIVAERTQDGETLQQGQGYLVPDFPQTADVLRTREPRAL